MAPNGITNSASFPGHSDELIESIANLLVSGKYSDIVITCQNDRYEVHRAIVCPRSSFFEAAFNGNFSEAINGKIDLPDDDPAAVEMMVHYLYHLDYTPSTISTSKVSPAPESETPPYIEADDLNQATPTVFDSRPVASFEENTPPPPPLPPPPAMSKKVSKMTKKKKAKPVLQPVSPFVNPSQTWGFSNITNSESSSHLCSHAKVYALGEKYGIRGLKALALQKFENEVEHHTESEDFLLAVKELYTSTVDEDRPLRDVVVKTMTKRTSLLNRESVQEVVKSTELGFDLLMNLTSASRGGWGFM
ncbi:hypothetical protein FSARC_10221 [Fusarium sarcochroum]|uniref:BTB domain-containing protein n=1 Tax=Fusarium sarcochroum TaxID=1208366 RepID=A0A8H4TNZ0_9HYPO|nr:hypothetical protein FSARC_10221 [Fusarium sarcochroum]